MYRCHSAISATEGAFAAHRGLWRMALLAALAGAPAAAAAQTVALTGSMGARALLVVDGKTATAAAGDTVHGVKVISVGSGQAVVEVRGRRQTLQMGAAQVNLGGGGSTGNGTQIVLTAGQGGHFQTLGQINGRTVNFLVDTGASMVSMSAAQATSLGLDYTKGQQGLIQTANGVAQAWHINLSRVRIGDVEVQNVDALVSPAELPVVLLGNSFLSRFQMKRENDRLTLERRF